MSITELLQELINPSRNIPSKIVESIIIILGLWLLNILFRQVINHRVSGVRKRHNLRKASAYIVAAIGVVILVWLWFPNIRGLATYLGLLSAGIAIALALPLTNLAGWMYIIWRRPLDIGDRVEINNYAGDVIDISLFQFTLLEIGNWVHADQSTGRVLHVPNRMIFDNSLANYTKGFNYIWHEIEVKITFESNWQKAKELLAEIASQDATSLSTDAAENIHKASQKFAIYYTKLTPIVYVTVIDYGILLTIRYLCEPRRRRSTEQVIWEDILKEFENHPDIQLAYPTQRFYQRNLELAETPSPDKASPPQQ